MGFQRVQHLLGGAKNLYLNLEASKVMEDTKPAGTHIMEYISAITIFQIYNFFLDGSVSDLCMHIIISGTLPIHHPNQQTYPQLSVSVS